MGYPRSFRLRFVVLSSRPSAQARGGQNLTQFAENNAWVSAQIRKDGLKDIQAFRLVKAISPMSLPEFDSDLHDTELDAMVENATRATTFLKAIGHEGRLMILCHLATGEKSVTELERLLCARQAAVSQQLGRLRLEGLVQPRREGKTIYYSLTDDRCKRIISVVHEMFCK